MQYLKNTLAGLGRHLHDSAMLAFQGSHPWWKLALFAAMLVLPGGTILAALAAWFEHRRHQRNRAAPREAHVDETAPYAQAPLHS